MMVIDNKFELGQVVYLKTDEDQKSRMVTKLTIYKTVIFYSLACGLEESCHEDFEISAEKDITVTINK